MLIVHPEEIKAQRQAIIVSLQKSVEHVIVDTVVGRSTEQNNSTLHYLQELNRVGLWPVSTYFREPGLKALLRKFHLFEKCHMGGCNCRGHDFKGHLHRVAVEIEAKRGLCLKCARHGMLSSQGGNCTAVLPADCNTSHARLTIPYSYLR